MDYFSTEFGRFSTAAEVAAGVDLSGRSAIVTGAASGIGAETARALAQTGAAVTLAVRNMDAGRKAAQRIAAVTANPRVRAAELDLADMDSVDAFTSRWNGPLHILVNNAGIMMAPESYTPQGWELQFATNHLGHFALACGLQPALAADGAARIVVVSSSGHGDSPVIFDDLFFNRRPYDAGAAYGQSKTANVLFAVEATRRWAADGITANALMPGGVWTNLQRHWDPAVLAAIKAQVLQAGLPVKSVEQGAATSVLLATAATLEGIGGRYFEDCNEAQTVSRITDGLHGVLDYALDAETAHRLWDVSAELLEAARSRR
ncbi:SDR family NAD(P)-dependent oxidoreductase [Micrococcaceae bacterium Sec5.8]